MNSAATLQTIPKAITSWSSPGLGGPVRTGPDATNSVPGDDGSSSAYTRPTSSDPTGTMPITIARGAFRR